MKKENEDNKIIYIGIGVFLWLTIGGFSVLFENIFKDILLNINIQPRIILWTKLAVQLITYILGFIIGIKIVKSSKKTNLRIFWNLIILFTLGQFLQFIQPYGIVFYVMDNYLNNLAELSEFTDSNLIENLIVNFIKFLGYFIVALIIYKNK
jgi:hypothetical protein